MGLFARLFGGLSSGQADDDTNEDTMVACEECGEEVPTSEVDEYGICDGCQNDDGTHYCCGVMYTDGEAECMSCGEWLSPK